MHDACPNCGVWLGNEPLPNDSAWALQQAEIERLRAAGDALGALVLRWSTLDGVSRKERNFASVVLDSWDEARRG